MLWRADGCRNGFRPFLTKEGDSGEPLDWDDIPLLKYESEIFVKTGAWKSLFELEENLTLDEMFMLYRACANEVNLQMKISAASQGAQVDFNDDWYEPQEEEYIGSHNYSSLPIGIGFEEVSSS